MTDESQNGTRDTPSPGSDTAPLWFGEVSPTGAPPSGRQTPTLDPAPTTELPVGPTHAPTDPTQPGRTHRAVELTAVAVLAALLASGGTYAATRAESQDARNPSTASVSSSPGRSTTAPAVAQGNTQAPDWAATASAVMPSVVAIVVTSEAGTDAGSGVILDTAGHILTNNHVVTGAQQIEVTLADHRTFSATLKGVDVTTDLAVVTLTNAPTGLQPIAIGDSDALKVGDPVMAIGNPLGLAGTVTTGIVSALNRPVNTGPQDSQTNPFGGQPTGQDVITNAIQTSAAINPGNSGGPLVDANGRLVGITSSIASLGSSSGQSGSIGIGFAIPIREAKAIADQLITTGTAQHAYLGVGIKDGSAPDGAAKIAGALVTSVDPGTPAAGAGIKVGDVIVAVDEVAIVSADALFANIRERTVGDTVQITLMRNGTRETIQAKLATRPASSP